MAQSTIPYSHNDCYYTKRIGIVSSRDTTTHTITVPLGTSHIIYLICAYPTKCALLYVSAFSDRANPVQVAEIYKGNDLTLTAQTNGILKIAKTDYGSLTVNDVSADGSNVYCTFT